MASRAHTVEEVFQDFKGRRAGLIKALTTDAEDFYNQCDPDKENLCLYGFPNEEWKVNLPAKEISSELPEPSVGINFARSGMQKTDWLSLVATHSDSWLFGVAFYYAAKYGFNKSEREHLFSMINKLQTILEVVDVAVQTPEEDEESILCDVCCIHDVDDGFWILCDFCERWYHGSCVKVTSALAKRINKYKCRFCQLHFG